MNSIRYTLILMSKYISYRVIFITYSDVYGNISCLNFTSVLFSISASMHAVNKNKHIVRNLYSYSFISDSKCMLNIYFIDFH